MQRIFWASCLSWLAIFSDISAIDNPADWFDTTVEVGAGYRFDKFDWSIAAPLGFPNTLAELDWNELQILQLQGKIVMTACDHIYTRLSGDFGWIMCGHNRYSVFAGNDKTFEISQSMNQSDGQWVFDGAFGIGYKFIIPEVDLQVAPLVGYSIHGQKLLITDGFQEISLFPEALGGIPGLSSKYQTRWSGGWLGADTVWQPTCHWKVFNEAEYHWVCYHGKGHWNLRNAANQFSSTFRDKSNGVGYVLTLGASYTTSPNWSMGLVGNYQHWHTKSNSSHHQVIAVNNVRQPFVGSLPQDVANPLNIIKWQSMSISLTFDTYF